MSVQATTYVIQGLRLPYSSKDSEKYERFEDYVDAFKPHFNRNEISVIFDGMNGQYIFVGFILAKGLESDGVPITKLKIRKRDFVLDAILKAIPDLDFFQYVAKDVRVYALTHFT